MKPIHMELMENGISIKIFSDPDPESPRSWDNLGTMVCFHKRYELGDKNHGFKTPVALQEKLDEKGVISLPIFMMDHSGLSLRTDPSMFQACDGAGWDWGKLGYIFADADTIRREYGVKKITKTIREKVVEVLNQEIETFNQYVVGEVFGFVIEDKKGEQLDACWGFYGYEYCLTSAKEAAQGFVPAAA